MTYTIYYSDPAKAGYPIKVADNTIYNGVGTGGITLVGRNYPAYGQFIAEDLVHLLENFSGPIPPLNPVEGQLWYDNINKKLRFNNGVASAVNWKPINGLYQQDIEPSDAVKGDVWVNTSNFLVQVHNGTDFAPLDGGIYDIITSTGIKLAKVFDNTNQQHEVVNIEVNGEVYATIARESFTTAEIPFITNVRPGVNVRSDAVFNGTADAATYLLQSGSKISGNLFVRNDINQTLNGQVTVSQDSNAFSIGTDPTFILERTSNGSNANFVNTYRYNGTFSFNIKDDYFANVRVMTVGNRVTVYGSEQSINAASGAFVVAGGVGIGKDLYIGGNLRFSNNTADIVVANIIATSKISVDGDLYFNRSLYAYENASSSNLVKGTPGQLLVSNGDSKVYWATLNSSGYSGGAVTAPMHSSSDLNSSPSGIGSYLNGAISTLGGASFARDVNIGGVTNLTTLTGTTSTFNYIKVNESLTVVKNTSATSTLTGALTVAGGVGIRGDLYVGGGIFSSRLTIDETVINSTVIQTGDQLAVTNLTNSTTPATGALKVSGGAGVLLNLNVGGTTIISTTTNSTSPITGALQVRGGVGIAGTVYIGGPTAFVAGSSVVTTATLGAARIDNDSIRTTNTGTMYVYTGTMLVPRAITATDIVSTATAVKLGGVRIGSNIDVNGDGIISLTAATASKLGLVIADDSRQNGIDTGLVNNGGTMQLFTATTVKLGGVRFPGGNNPPISSLPNGTMIFNTGTLMTQAVSITTPASLSTLGAVRIGNGIDVTPLGTISVSSVISSYETGAWTPVFSFATTGTTLGGGSGTYVKLNKYVYVQGEVYTTSTFSPSGAVRITGLPFQNDSGFNSGVSVTQSASWGTASPKGGYILNGVNYITLLTASTSNFITASIDTGLTGEDFDITLGTRNQVFFTGWYITNS